MTATTNNAAQQGTAPAGAQTAVAAQPTAVELQKKQVAITNEVLDRVNAMQQAGELKLPDGYTAGNALKFAWLALQDIKDRNGRAALEVCTKASIANSLLKMCIYGESIGKQQCYFIVTGNVLSYFEDYRGKLMRAKRDTEIKEVHAQVVYEGDEFTYTIDDNGEYQLVEHKTKLENINIAKIKAAYAVVINKDGSKHIEIMTMEMIRNSWGQGAAKGNSMAHTKFTDQMAKKTVISRACKIALGAATEEPDEVDRAQMEREAAQQTPALQKAEDAQFEELKDATQVVDVATGEVIQQAPAEAAQPVQQAAPVDDCPI